MFFEGECKPGASVAGLALVALLGMVGCHQRVVVGTEEPSAALQSAPDAGLADVAEPPDADDVDSDEGDDGDDGDDDAADDTEDSQDDDD